MIYVLEAEALKNFLYCSVYSYGGLGYIVGKGLPGRAQTALSTLKLPWQCQTKESPHTAC
jgi:hypothetical protein